jgi:hypothetical protein
MPDGQRWRERQVAAALLLLQLLLPVLLTPCAAKADNTGSLKGKNQLNELLITMNVVGSSCQRRFWQL